MNFTFSFSYDFSNFKHYLERLKKAWSRPENSHPIPSWSSFSNSATGNDKEKGFNHKPIKEYKKKHQLGKNEKIHQDSNNQDSRLNLNNRQKNKKNKKRVTSKSSNPQENLYQQIPKEREREGREKLTTNINNSPFKSINGDENSPSFSQSVWVLCEIWLSRSI